MPPQPLRRARPGALKYFSIIGGLIIAIGVWTAGAAGLFRLPDAVFYDLCTRWGAAHRDVSNQVLLIAFDPLSGRRHDGSWERLFDELTSLGPRKILFTFLPRDVSPLFYERAAAQGNVIFGRRISRSPERSDAPLLEPLPPAAEGVRLSLGFVAAPPADYGVHRRQYVRFERDGLKAPSLEAAALPATARPAASLFRINFIGKERGLPTVSMERALMGDLVPALIKDRYVVIGPGKSPFETGYYTPVTPQNGMSSLQLHGCALDTLLSGEWVTDVSQKTALALIGGIVLFLLLIDRFVGIGLLTWFALALGAALLGAAWLCLSLFSVWIPAAELLLTVLLTLVFILRSRSVRQEERLRNLLFQASAKSKERLIPEIFYEVDDPWTPIMVMLDQTLDLTRSILLEPFEKDHRVREIKALKCSIEDIHERRRDYHRPPYSDAIRENGMIRLDRRPFFKSGPPEERQYMAPLIYAGRLLGFWVFGMKTGDGAAADIPNFEAVISDFGGRIGELLFRREHRREHRFSTPKGWRRFLWPARPKVLDRELYKILLLLERRLNLMDAAFDNTGAAVAMYDHFGQILHLNKRMADLMNASDLLPYGTTVIEFIKRTTPAAASEARQILRQFLFERRTAILPATLPGEPNRQYRLGIRALLLEDQTIQSDFAYPFHSYGILLELDEITDLQLFNQLKTELLNAVDHRLRRDLAPIRCAAALLSRRDLPEPDRKRAEAVLDRRMDGLAAYIHQAGEDLRKDIFTARSKDFPIDPVQALQGAAEAIGDRAGSRKVAVPLGHFPDTVNLVCADPERLPAIFQTVLTVLIDDAVENTSLQIDLVETEDEFIFTFSNTGFGMPDSIFKEYLSGETAVSSPEFQRLRTGAAELERGGGKLTGSSEMGVGIRFILHLTSRLCTL